MSELEKKAKTARDIWLEVKYQDESKMLLDPSPSSREWVRLEDAKQAVYDESVKRQIFHTQTIEEHNERRRFKNDESRF